MSHLNIAAFQAVARQGQLSQYLGRGADPVGYNHQDAFNQLFLGNRQARPEEALCDKFQQVAHSCFAQQLNVASQLEAAAADPVKMVGAQFKLSSATLTVELTAKVVGSFAQAINRLVSIQ